MPNAVAKRIAADIKQFGWHCIKVPDFEMGSLSYTIGLQETFGHPELAMFGLDVNLQHQLLHSIVEQIREGQRFGDGDRIGDVLAGGLELAVRQVDASHIDAVFAQAVNHAGSGRSVEDLQVFWPDRAGAFPWDKSVTTSRQQLLYEVATSDTRKPPPAKSRRRTSS